MKLYNDYSEFKADDRALREVMRMTSDDYLSHVKSAMTFFHTTGNHNIQIVNDVLDTASAGRLQRNRIVDWLAALVGHEVVKVPGDKFGFGKKLEESVYEEILDNAADYLEQYPDWYAFKPEQAPEEFDGLKTMSQLIKRVKTIADKYGKHDYAMLHAELTKIAEHLEVLPVQPSHEPESVEGDTEEPAAVAA